MAPLAVLAILAAWYWNGRSQRAAEEAAIHGYERMSGLTNVRVERSFSDGDCAVVELHHAAMKYGVTSVALSKNGGAWTVVVIQDDDKGISFDPDDAAGGGCRDILQSGGHKR